MTHSRPPCGVTAELAARIDRERRQRARAVCLTDRPARSFVLASHVTREPSAPFPYLECDGGVIVYGESGRHVVDHERRRVNGLRRSRRPTISSRSSLRHRPRRLPGRHDVRRRSGGRQTACMIGMHESAVAIVTFPALIRRGSRASGPRCSGLEEECSAAIRRGACERDRLPWAEPGGGAGRRSVVLRGCRGRAVSGRPRQERVVNSRELVQAHAALRQASAGPTSSLGAALGPSSNTRLGGSPPRGVPRDLMAAPQLYRGTAPGRGQPLREGPLHRRVGACRFHNIHGGVIALSTSRSSRTGRS